MSIMEKDEPQKELPGTLNASCVPLGVSRVCDCLIGFSRVSLGERAAEVASRDDDVGASLDGSSHGRAELPRQRLSVSKSELNFLRGGP
jgi:hypothetical protein